MNENELYVVKDYKFDNPLITKIDFIIDGCYRDCHNNFFHIFKYECIYDIKHTNVTINKLFNLTVSDKSMKSYELNKKLKVARHNGFLFNQMHKLTSKFYSHLRYINTSYCLKSQIPMCRRKVFRKTSQSREYIHNFCTDMENPFHSACKKWFNQLN